MANKLMLHHLRMKEMIRREVNKWLHDSEAPRLREMLGEDEYFYRMTRAVAGKAITMTKKFFKKAR